MFKALLPLTFVPPGDGKAWNFEETLLPYFHFEIKVIFNVNTLVSAGLTSATNPQLHNGLK